MALSNRFIRRSLTVAVLGVLGMLWLLAVILLDRAREFELREAAARMDGKAAVLAEYVRSVFGHLDAVLIDLRDHITPEMTLPEHEAVRHAKDLKGFGKQLSIIDREGRLSFSTLGAVSLDMSEREQYRFFSEGGDPNALYLTRPILGRLSGEFSVFAARPVIGPSGFRGVVQVSIAPEMFSRFMKGLATRPDDVFALVRNSGEVMAVYPIGSVPLGTTVTGSPIIAPDAPESGSFHGVGIDKTQRFFAYKSLPEYGLVMVTGRSEAAVLNSFELRRKRIYVGAAVCTAIMLALLWGLRRALAYNDRIQSKLREAVKHAEAASEEKSRFLATMSHELRTPLNGVVGMSQLLLETPLNERQRDFAVSIERSGQAVVDLVTDILDLSKIEAGRIDLHPKPFDMIECVESIRAMFRHRAEEKGLALRVTVDPQAQGMFEGDIVRIRQVLINLMGNALKFTEQGDVTLTVISTGDRVSFAVADTGVGIAPSERERVFERFTQVDMSHARRHEGTGLGLAICRQLVQAMGGTIVCEGRDPARGSLFRVVLPLKHVEDSTPPQTELSSQRIAPERSAALAREPLHMQRLLLVEDNPVNQKVALLMLERLGYSNVALAADGEAALRALAQQRYSLVLMDVRMPGMDGLEVTRRLRAVDGPNVDVPVIAVTANALQEDRDDCLAAGMNDFLPKPLQLKELALCVSQWERAIGSGTTEPCQPGSLNDTSKVPMTP
jgi:hypothetical protein